MFHSITLVGRVGAEPEAKTTMSGLKLASFNLAVDIKSKDKKITIWPRITAFGSLSDIVTQYVHKGTVLLVEGRLSPDPTTGGPKVYQKRDGTMAASYDITAEKIQLIGGGEKPSTGPSIEGLENIEEIDIPF